MANPEMLAYWKIYHGESVARSSLKTSGLREALGSMLLKGEFIGNYSLDGDLIVAKRGIEVQLPSGKKI